MSFRAAQKRLAALEAAQHGPDAHAVRFGDEPFVWRHGERMPLADWERNYPRGVLIRVAWVDWNTSEDDDAEYQ